MPILFAILAGTLLGLAVASARTTARLGRAGTFGLLAAAAGVLLLTPSFANRVNVWFSETFDVWL